MTTYYVGPGGNDGNAGTSWGARKLTLNGVEDIPVVAGDTVYVGPGTYRELLTVDVSGSSGSPITYIGDYTGANTDGTGGLVRITGSDNDQTLTRSYCIDGAGKDYRTFQGFSLDMASTHAIRTITNCSSWIIEDCFLGATGNNFAIRIEGTATGFTIRRCVFNTGGQSRYGVLLVNGSTHDNAGHVVENCLFMTGQRGVSSSRVGGVTVRNCLFYGLGQRAVAVDTALSAGQTVNVNNCIFYACGFALYATTTGEITEDYNTFFANVVDRTNTSTGSNSVTYPPLFDSRWLFEATLNGGTLATQFDLASYSPLVELNSGSGAPSADLRGTTVQGSYREWGPFEYDSTLDTEAGAGGGGLASSLFGGGIVR